MKSAIHIGTSGWHYKHWRGTFYPADIDAADMLGCYAQRFRTVEINNSFYRLPSEDAVRSWIRHTPPEFVFAVKASRYITHNRKLKEPKETTAKFLEIAKRFGKKLGPILFQFPPGWRVNRERLKEFLKSLPRRNRYAFEFRDPSWHVEEICGLLKRFNAAFCVFDIGGFQSPVEVTADFTYVRLHGPGKPYQGKYSEFALRAWAKRIREWVQDNREVFFYFDNDQAGYAAQDALELSRMVSGTKSAAETSTPRRHVSGHHATDRARP